MTNNELSKEIILLLFNEPSKSMKFSEIVKKVSVDKKRLALNLFYLEENGFIELRSVYNSDSLFPEIYMVSLKQKGGHIAENAEVLNTIFPSNMDYSLLDLPLLLQNLLRAMEQWSEKDEEKLSLYKEISEILRKPLFLKFLEETYSGRRAK